MAGQAQTSPTSLRYEELVAQREELEVLKRENETLRRRIKDLEVERRNSRGSGSTPNLDSHG
jgi:cell division protein FtsB